MSRHGRGLFPAGLALIQRCIKITKKLLLSAMTANAIYVCKHVQCISSVNIDRTPMALALLKVPHFVGHLFCCTRFVYMTHKQQDWYEYQCCTKGRTSCAAIFLQKVSQKNVKSAPASQSNTWADAHRKSSCRRHTKLI